MTRPTHSLLRKLTSRFLALALIPCVAMNARAEDDDQDDQPQQLASFSADHKQIVVQSPGVKDFSFGTAVRVLVDGQHMSISSDLDEVHFVQIAGNAHVLAIHQHANRRAEAEVLHPGRLHNDLFVVC